MKCNWSEGQKIDLAALDYANGARKESCWLYGDEYRICYRYPNGDIYIGTFENNSRNGFGHYLYENGNSYKGMWKDGQKEGYGILSTEKSIYIGSFSSNQKNGLGVLISEDQLYYGEFKNDKKCGLGVCCYKDNEPLLLYWYEDGLINPSGDLSVLYDKIETLEYVDGELYKGIVQNDKRNGFGVCFTNEGQSIFGNWVNDCLQGYGIILVNKNIYVGEFIDGQQVNFGIHSDENDNVYIGQFKDCDYEGEGILYFEDGRYYKGQFKKGVQHGHGEYYNAKDHLVVGDFSDPEYIEVDFIIDEKGNINLN